MLRLPTCVALAALLALPLAAQQQDTSAPPPRQKPSAALKKKDLPPKSSATQNAFPEAQSEAAARQAQQQQNGEPSAPVPRTPAPSAPAPQSKSPTANQNPFPEAESEKAAHQAQQQQNPPPPPRSGGSGFSSSQVSLKDLAPADNSPAPVLSPEVARKDISVGTFYLQTGDYKGAYSRFLEATHIDPGSAEAVYGLAEAARHLNNREVALHYYWLYLSALPHGPRAKDVRKALKKMDASPRP